MHFAKFFAVVGLFVGAGLAAPNAEPNPPKPVKPSPPPPPPPTPPQQSNACGNGATPYCCFADAHGGYNTCYSYEFSNQCSAINICCNANNSVQNCIGAAKIATPPYYPYSY